MGHQYRLMPGLVEARRRLASGAIGALRMVTAALASPWLGSHNDPEDSWRFAPKAGGTGILADEGDHLLDALLWTTGRAAAEVAAIQNRREPGLDVVDRRRAPAGRRHPGHPGHLRRFTRTPIRT